MPGDIVHRTKLFNGRTTAMELHRRLAWNGAKCDGCGAADTALRVQTFVLLSDMSSETRMALEFQIAMGRLHTVEMAAGRAIRTGIMHACPRCSPALERATAKGPSYAIVWLERGPGEDKPSVGVLTSVP